MEISVIGCVPHVPPDPVNSGFANDNQRKVCFKPKKNIDFLGASISGLKTSQDVPMNSVFGQDLMQKIPSKVCNKNVIIVQSKDIADDEITLDMKVETEDELNLIPIVAESSFSRVNGICADDVAISVSAPLTIDVSPTKAEASSSVASTNDPSSSNDSYGAESFVSFDASNASDASPDKKKRYLFLFRPNLGKILVKNKNANTYRCFVCGGIYRQKFSLKRHYLRSHIDFRYISEADIANCKIPVPNYVTEQHSNPESCKTSNGRKKFKKSVNDVFLENNDSRQMPGLYRCHDCSEVFCNSEMELKNHYNEHPDSVKKKFECHICGAAFFKKQILSRHLAGHGEKVTKNICRKCNIAFTSKVELQRHLSSHIGGRKCKYCTKILSTSANRKRHEALHEGIKQYRCVHCEIYFAQRKDLDRHLRKQHSNLCRICSLCNKVFPTEAHLSTHVREKHTSSPKFQENQNKSEVLDKPAVPKSTSPKPISCVVCKRVFQTLYAMMKHKRNAHPFHSRKKRRHRRTYKKKKEAESVSTGLNSYQKSQMSSSTDAKRTKPNARPGPRKQKRVQELADERAKLEAVKFYNLVHENIAENLTNYVDGKAHQLSLKQYNFSDLQYSSDLEERTHIPWSNYNFPQWYDVENALKTKGREIKLPENMSAQNERLCEAIGLAPAHSSSDVKDPEKDNGAAKKVLTPVKHQETENLTLEQQKALIGKSIISIIVCCVCKEKFNSYPDYNEHCTNNHPNVECSFIEVEGDEESPPVVPQELCMINLSSIGSRFSCDVPPQLSEGILKCTKCFRQFKKGPELHEHVNSCGNVGNFSKAYVPPRPNPQRRIKRTMKKRMTLEQQQAALEGNRFRLFEKGDSVLYRLKSNDKLALMDKPQFYKTGRPRTKSLTVDMNYFNTKPKKPVSTISKRGRKSYALVSSMYRNGTMQAARNVQSISKRGRKSYATQPFMYKTANARPSSSRECPDCDIVFDSIHDFNNHSCIISSFKKTDTLKLAPNNVKKNLTKTVFDNMFINEKHSSESLSGSYKFPGSFLNREISTSDKRRSSINDISSSEEVDIPIDLSRNAKYNSHLGSHSSETKSAVQIAMEKALNFVEKMKSIQATQATSNEKSDPAHSAQAAGIGLVSPISKPVTGKKVGRPRKLKKLDEAAPLSVQNNVTSDIVKKKNVNSKPGKLEETIQKLTVRSKEKQMQSTSTASDISVVKPTDTTPSSDIQSLTMSDVPLAQSDVILPEMMKGKEKSESIAVDITEGNSKNSVPSDLLPANEVNTSSQGNDKLQSIGNVSCGEQITPIKKNTDNATTFEPVVGKDSDFKNDSQIVLPPIPSAEFSLGEPVKGNQNDNQSMNTGRSSPTFESILKVINQKLHSEEQESSQQDDTAISWLEDEQFEIPPSRSALNITVPSSSILLTTCEKPILVSEVVKVHESVKQNILPVSLQALSKEPLEQVPETTSTNDDAALSITSSVDNLEVVKNASNQEMSSPTEKSEKTEKLPEKMSASSKTNKDSNSAAKKEISSKPIITKKVTFSNASVDSSLVPTKKSKDANSFPVMRKSPGRPRKKVSDGDTEIPDKNIDGMVLSGLKEDKTPPISENDQLIQSDLMPNDSDTAKHVKSSNEEKAQTNQESTAKNDKAVSMPPNFVQSDKTDIATESELPSPSLRNFRTKSKQTPSIDNLLLVSQVPVSTTTEFGKSLASRMKEKMRLSFDPDACKISVGGTEESNFSTSAETSDTNSQASNEDVKNLKAVKKEGESSEKIHFCPYCMLEFAYLTNFRRHIKKCQARPDKKTLEPVPGASSTHLQHLPKKDEVDYSMLNLYRHQSRQTQMMKEVVPVDNSPIKTPISKYECTICHRIFLNLFNFMQHKTQHKLTVSKNNPENEDMIDEMDFLDNQIPENGEKFEAEASELSYEKETENQEVVGASLTTSISSEIETGDKKESGADEGKESTEAVQDSATDEALSTDVQRVKRKKRGRPVGWKRNLNSMQENIEHKDSNNEPKPIIKDAELLVEKGLNVQPVDGFEAVCNKLKVKNIKDILLSKLGKLPVRKKQKLEAEGAIESVPQPERTFQLSTKEMVKDSPKQAAVKDVTDSKNALSSNTEDVPQILKNPLMKSEKVENKNSTSETDSTVLKKRGRGKSVPLSVGVQKKSQPKSEFPLKRKLGRPSKNLLSTPSTSQSGRANYSQSSMRSTRKMIAVPANIDSSDSESEKTKVEIPTKKKIHLKICALCKEKFASNLELIRHIQLVHSRRMQPVPNKNESVKVPKKVSPKVPPTSVSAVVRRSASPQKKVSTMKACCTVCKKEFHSALLLRSHIQVHHSKVLESNADKTESRTTDGDSINNKPDDQLAFSPAASTSEANSGISPKREAITPKKIQKHKVCALCKKKFVTSMLLRNHIQTVHSRKSDGHVAVQSTVSRRSLPVAVKSDPVPISSPVKVKESKIMTDRSSLSRQCRKPLPPLKRKRMKKEPTEQAVKKSKL